MQNKNLGVAAALLAGVLLAVMIFINGQLAVYTSPVWASMAAHLIGFIAAWAFIGFAVRGTFTPATPGVKTPLWAYLGGVPGALIVIIASMTINSQIGLIGTLALMLLGQVVFSIVIDAFGLFGMPRRSVNAYDFLSVLSTMCGAALIIFFSR